MEQKNILALNDRQDSGPYIEDCRVLSSFLGILNGGAVNNIFVRSNTNIRIFDLTNHTFPQVCQIESAIDPRIFEYLTNRERMMVKG